MKKRLSKDERRKNIIISAIMVFSKKNFNAATTAEIAKEAGVSEALIYQHFKSKKELFLESMDFTGTFFVENLKELLNQYTNDPVEGFRAVYKFYYNYLKQNPTLAKMSLMITAEADDIDIKEKLKKYLDKSAEILEKSIRNTQKKGLLLKSANPKILAWTIVGNYQLLSLLKLTDNLNIFDEQSVISLIEPFIPKKK